MGWARDGWNKNAFALTLQLKSDTTNDHTFSGSICQLTAHETVNFGDVCFINSDSEAALADASSTAKMPGVVMALGTVAANTKGNFLLSGFVRDNTWNFTSGDTVFISINGTTGNTLSPSASKPSTTGEQVQAVAFAMTADIIFFNPMNVLVEVP